MNKTAAALHAEALQVPEPGIWAIDPTHTQAGFAARHLMVTKVRGRFTDVSGTATIGETPETSSVEVELRAASVDTGFGQRDDHLRSADFFDVERYPTLTFRSTRVQRTGERTFKLHGDLTIRGVTRPVTLDAEYEGVTSDPWGGQRAGFTASTEVNREDWGLTWNQALESGGVVVGKKVKIEIETELVKK